MMTDEIKMRAVEIAERTLNTYTNGANGQYLYKDKDMKEMFRRADSIVAYVTGTENEEPKALMNKLRDLLCDKS